MAQTSSAMALTRGTGDEVSFSKLPPELRNTIYDFYFEDTSGHGAILDLSKANRYLANPALTAVCKEIRCETLQYYRAATARYWASHSFFISVHAFGSGPLRTQHEHIQSAVAALYSRPQIKILTFKVSWGSLGATTVRVTAMSTVSSVYALRVVWDEPVPAPRAVRYTDVLKVELQQGLLHELHQSSRSIKQGGQRKTRKFVPSLRSQSRSQLELARCIEQLFEGVEETKSQTSFGAGEARH